MKKALPLVALILTVACGRGGRVPEVLAVLPDFTMTAIGSQMETPFGRKDMLGSVWIADFIFTRCGGPCPLLSQRMAKLSKELPPEVRYLSVTVDPEGDTPERLRDYAAAFGAWPYGKGPGTAETSSSFRGAQTPRWLFLRGSTAETYRLLYAGFRQHMSIDPKAQPASRVTHSTRFVLVDRKGAIRGFYDGLNDLDNAALARDARRLVEAGA